MRLKRFLYLIFPMVAACATGSSTWTTKAANGVWNKSDACNVEARADNWSFFGTSYKTVSRQPYCTATTCAYNNPNRNKTYEQKTIRGAFHVAYDLDDGPAKTGLMERWPPSSPMISRDDYARIKVSVQLKDAPHKLLIGLPPSFVWEGVQSAIQSGSVAITLTDMATAEQIELAGALNPWTRPTGSAQQDGVFVSVSLYTAEDVGELFARLARSDQIGGADKTLVITDPSRGLAIYETAFEGMPHAEWRAAFAQWEATLDRCAS